MCICHIKREEERDLYEIVQALEIGKGVGDNTEKVMMPKELYMPPTKNML